LAYARRECGGGRPGRPHGGTVTRGLSALARQAAAKTRAVSGRVHDHAVVTPLIGLAAAREECGTDILLKCEHQQKTGSFKVRGALAKLLSLGEGQRDRGVVAASSGNHGLEVAYALSAAGGTEIVCVPEHASPVKVAAIRRYGVDVRVVGQEPAETERLARLWAAEAEMSYISPYNDLDVIAGQGTVGEEIVQQLGARAVDALPTISDGTAGGVEEGSITLPLCTELVDEWVLIEEPEICSASSS